MVVVGATGASVVVGATGASVVVGATVTVGDAAGAADVVAADKSSATTGPAGPGLEPQAAVRRIRTPRPNPIIRSAIFGS